MAATSTAQPSNPFIKQLASSDRKIRDRALSSLRTYLHRSKPFTPLDLLKLWKGLFYCMWMSDKPRTQQQLARDLADLCDVLTTKENLLGFIDAFWKTMASQWANIDALRMDKYLYLVRCYVGKGFEKVARKGWNDEQLLDEYLKVLEAVPLDARDHKIPNGLRYHVIDIYVDELDKVDTDRTAPLEKILQPLRQLAQDTRTKPVGKKVREALGDERLSDWKNEGAADDGDGAEHGMAGLGEVAHGTAGAADNAGDDDEFGGFDD
ncbi:hypothetical protein LTR36_005297 [Oleoguttula mirabilis]|uniref:Uncharacterized protein n=1 Tax=Oleoguttula mirabilis TaxID=1507867 RepID=A0AAV9JED0_9PEZI|nr:hypothetical protein LTR36_005297 [Oleoguttula mirabilis]